MRDTVWKSREQADLWEAVASENPKRPGESSIEYMERIACLCGGVKPEELLLNKPDKLKSYGEHIDKEDGGWLPYKD